MKLLKSLSISRKLIGGFGTVFLFFVLVMGIYHRTVVTTAHTYKDIMRVNASLTDQASRIKALIMECKIREKDFLSSLDRNYLGQLQESIQLLEAASQGIRSGLREDGSRKIDSVARDITVGIETYSHHFRDLDAAYAKRGTDGSSGLFGEFLSAAESFVNEMSYLNVEDLYVHLLRMVKLQNDFQKGRDPGILERLAALLAVYPEVIEGSTADTEAVKDALKDSMAAYGIYLQELLTSSVSIQEQDRVIASMDEIVSEMEAVFNLLYLPNAKPMIQDIRSNEKDYLLLKTPENIARVQDTISTLASAIQVSQVVGDFKKSCTGRLNAYQEAFDRLVEADNEIRFAVLAMGEAAMSVDALCSDLFNETAALIAAGAVDVDIRAADRARLSLMIGVGAMLLGILLALGITRQINRPLVRAVLFSKEMSRGNFTDRIKIDQRDEIGDLTGALNEIVINLGGMISGVAEEVDTVSSSSSNLHQVSETLSRGADSMADKFTAILDSAEKMSTNLSSVVDTTARTLNRLTAVTLASRESTAAITTIAKDAGNARFIAGKAVEQARTATSDMEQLYMAADGISSVTETISMISDQTNLLSLNAAIEAARAGDAGRGFSVVANEIKSLAGQTAEATQGIFDKISAIQQTTARTVEEISSVGQTISDIDIIIDQIALATATQSSAAQEIETNIVQASEGFRHLNDNVTACSEKASRIVADVSVANQEAAQMSADSTRLNASASDLASLAEKLKTMAGRFQV